MRISLLATPRNAWLLLLVCASSVCAQTAPVPGDTVITLERTTCGGECPAYRVSIDARGNVVYEGTEFVRVKGLQRDQISVAHVTALLETATRIGFFELREQYRFIQNPDATQRIVTDLPTALTAETPATPETGASLSVLDIERRSHELLVQSFHLFDENQMVIKTQSIIEVIKNA